MEKLFAKFGRPMAVLLILLGGIALLALVIKILHRFQWPGTYLQKELERWKERLAVRFQRYTGSDSFQQFLKDFFSELLTKRKTQNHPS